MERTPSPPPRLRTPPAPLHGPRFDSYEPYAPRRTTRSTARREQQLQASPTRARQSRAGRAASPSSSKKKNAARISNHGLSPPSSPASPYDQRSSLRSTRRGRLEVGPVDTIDTDSDHEVAPTPSKRFLSAMDPTGSIPTPAKTPRKRAVKSQEVLRSTARVLFPPRPATIEEAMPTPRKNRRSTRNTSTLGSFAELDEEADDEIPIYTDSKERIPEVDDSEDNPFVTKKGKGKAKANGTTKSRKTASKEAVDASAAKMQEMANNDEGLIFSFRGKKVFRYFAEDGSDPYNPHNVDFVGEEVRRQAGHEGSRRLMRSSITPRMLFQEEIAQRNREQGLDEYDDDEDAITDIEIPPTTPEQCINGLVVQEATPPPTRRVKRREDVDMFSDGSDTDDSTEVSFEGWSRMKPSSAGGSTKRPGSPLEGAPTKQSRSEPTSAMSIDE